MEEIFADPPEEMELTEEESDPSEEMEIKKDPRRRRGRYFKKIGKFFKKHGKKIVKVVKVVSSKIRTCCKYGKCKGKWYCFGNRRDYASKYNMDAGMIDGYAFEEMK